MELLSFFENFDAIVQILSALSVLAIAIATAFAAPKLIASFTRIINLLETILQKDLDKDGDIGKN